MGWNKAAYSGFAFHSDDLYVPSRRVTIDRVTRYFGPPIVMFLTYVFRFHNSHKFYIRTPLLWICSM